MMQAVAKVKKSDFGLSWRSLATTPYGKRTSIIMRKIRPV